MEYEMPQMVPQIWQVEWVDSYTLEGSWQSSETIEQINDNSTCKCTTIGYLAKETNNSYVMAGSKNGLEYGGVMVIPKVCVINKRVIR